MALRRIALRDFVIVRELELDLSERLQRADRRNRRRQVHPDRRAAAGAGHPRRRRRRCAKAPRAPTSAPSSTLTPALAPLAGRRRLRNRRRACCCAAASTARARAAAWINGSPATATQLRELADQLVDIHGQHAWQSLTRPDAVRGLLDGYAGVSTDALQQLWQRWRAAQQDAGRRPRRAGFAAARTRAARLADRRGGQAGARRRRMGRAQRPATPAWPMRSRCSKRRKARCEALEDDEGGALAALSQAPGAAAGPGARRAGSSRSWRRCWPPAWRRPRTPRIRCTRYLRKTDTRSAAPGRTGRAHVAVDVAGAPLQAHAGRTAGLLAGWKQELATLDAAADLAALEAAEQAGAACLHDRSPGAVARPATKAAPQLAKAVTQAMQGLGMQGGRFEVALQPAGSAGRSAAWKKSASWWPAMPAARRGRSARWPPAASCRASRWRSRSPPASSAPRRR